MHWHRAERGFEPIFEADWTLIHARISRGNTEIKHSEVLVDRPNELTAWEWGSDNVKASNIAAMADREEHAFLGEEKAPSRYLLHLGPTRPSAATSSDAPDSAHSATPNS